MDENNYLSSELVASIPVENATNFWKAIKLAVIKPHTINRILSGGEIITVHQCSSININSDGKLIRRINFLLTNGNRSICDANFVENFFRKLSIPLDLVDKEKLTINDDNDSNTLKIVLSKYFPRNLKVHQNSFELILLGKYFHPTKISKFKA